MFEFTKCKGRELRCSNLQNVKGGSLDERGDAINAFEAMLNKCTICLMILRTFLFIYHNFIYFL